jgi:hypothetical protein
MLFFDTSRGIALHDKMFKETMAHYRGNHFLWQQAMILYKACPSQSHNHYLQQMEY